MKKNWDVIVVGAGHAGCEAAHAAQQMGQQTLLLTMTLDNIAQMSCNPAIGGVGKGHLVKEIDALGGIMGLLADQTGIQFRQLNTSKGAAVRATRCQSDMLAYKIAMKKLLNTLPNLHVAQAEVAQLLWNQDSVLGVETALGEAIYAKAVIVTTGTFLNGCIHIGDRRFSAGRAWEFPSSQLSGNLKDHGVSVGRLKTGTTPRLHQDSIDFNKLEPQYSDNPLPKFSFWEDSKTLPQIPCHITYTNPNTHEIIQQNIQQSAVYGGGIDSVGPRYCPSIEDKVHRFKDKERHQIFLEPTSLDSVEIYPNGISTSLPLEIQQEFVHSIEGLQNAQIMRPGYAIEYDFVHPHQLSPSLALRSFKNLYLAGQINGTTGYEEAAAQGLMAGMNAALLNQQKEPLLLKRNQSYIGVLIDDLISKGTDEPYRMFTSRAEYRLILREDNADMRLSKLGHEVGLLSQQKYEQWQKKQEHCQALNQFLKTSPTRNLNPARNAKLDSPGFTPAPLKAATLFDLLKKPGFNFEELDALASQDLQAELKQWTHAEKKVVAADIKYAGYIKRQTSQIKRYQQLDAVRLPQTLDYKIIGGLSNEVVEKLSQHKPRTLAQAYRISGITPAAITILMVYLQKMSKLRAISRKT